MSKMQEAYLPTATELEQMSKEEFEQWIFRTKQELPKRAERRDPLFHLQKRISSVLKNNELTEIQREFQVLCEIERFEQIKN